MQHLDVGPRLEEPEIILDPAERWWVSRLNRLVSVQQGIKLPATVKLRDCTLREGEETPGTRLSREDKLELALRIQDTGIQEIEVGYCGAIEEHRDLARFLRGGGVTAKLTSINRTYALEGEWQAEIDNAVEAGVDCISLVVFCNDDLLKSVPWLQKTQVPDRVFNCVTYAREQGVEVAASLAGATRTNPIWIEAFSQAAVGGGASVIAVADSMGCALPETISFIIRKVRDTAGPAPTIAFHGHNTFGLATANALAAVKAGAEIVDAVPLGLGEGAGITPLEEIAFSLEVLYGVGTGLCIEKISDLCQLVKEKFGVEFLPTKTFVGEGLYRHSIDSHVASMLRGDWHTWECIHPSVLGQERRLEFGFAKIRRGRSGAIAAKIESLGQDADDAQLNGIIDRVCEIATTRGHATESEVEEVIRESLGVSG